MATSRKQLKEIPCKYEIGDTFSDGNRNYTVLARRTRDDFHAILKEPMYMMERFPGEVIKNNKCVLTLNTVEMTESQINRLIGFTWRKVE